MNRDELIETIQRLIALSSSSNEHESALALARASELMAKHNISMAQVETQKVNANYTTEEVFKGGRAQNSEAFIVDILQQYFFVQSVSFRNYRERITTLKFFGDRHNVEIAKFIYHFLTRLYKELADLHRISARDRRTYYAGVSKGLKDKLQKERDSLNKASENRNALIVVDKALVEAFKKEFPKLKYKSYAGLSNNMNAYNLGLKDGANINLRKGLENKSASAQQLTS